MGNCCCSNSHLTLVSATRSLSLSFPLCDDVSVCVCHFRIQQHAPAKIAVLPLPLALFYSLFLSIYLSLSAFLVHVRCLSLLFVLRFCGLSASCSRRRRSRHRQSPRIAASNKCIAKNNMKTDARTQQEKERMRGREREGQREREGKTVGYANVTKMLIGFYFIQTKYLVTTTDKTDPTDTTATTTEATEDKQRKKDRQKRHRNPSEWNLI